MKTQLAVTDDDSIKRNPKSQELKACRACLSTDVKLFELGKNGLAQSFGDVTGAPVSDTDGLPQHICFYCCAMLRKSAMFRNKCQQAHYFFLEKRMEHPVITNETIRTLDFKIFAIPLDIPKILNLEYAPSDNAVEIETQDGLYENAQFSHQKVDFCDIKTEVDGIPSLDDQHFDEDDQIFGNEQLDDDQFVQELTVNECVTAEEVKIKIEKPHSSKDKKKVTKDKSKKRDTKKKEEKEVKRKRKYNAKFEEDFESFSKMYNVDVIFLTKEQQVESIRSRKDSNKEHRFTCDVCFMGFFTENAHKKHMDLHNPDRGSHICEVCQHRYPTRKLMLRHARIHKMQFICKICNQVNKSTCRAKLHHNWHQGFKFECPHCLKKFNVQSTKLNHIREHHTLVRCGVCRETVAGTNELAKHKKSCHVPDSQSTQGCAECGVLFHNMEALNCHKSQAHGCNTSLRPCPACGINFTMRDLEQHTREMHQGSLFKCKDCPSTFTSDRKLGIHWSRTHGAKQDPEGKEPRAGNKTYMCEVCAKKFATPVQLKYHQRMHTDERPYSCSMCPKKFRVPGNLRVHLNIHTGERPFKCRYCPEKFKSYSQRHKHKLLVHTKERRYKCHLCEKTYIVSFDLKSHIRFTHLHVPRPPRVRNRDRNT